MTTLEKRRIGAFEVISRSARHRATQDVFYGYEWHTDEWDVVTPDAWEWVYDLSRRSQRVTERDFSVVTHQAGQYVSAYIASMLTMFVQTAATESPRLSALETRLGRIERALRSAGIECRDDAPGIDWESVKEALPKVTEALGWKAELSVDTKQALVSVRVAGVDRLVLARQTLDFYEQLAAAVDTETFKGLDFDIEPQE